MTDFTAQHGTARHSTRRYGTIQDSTVVGRRNPTARHEGAPGSRAFLRCICIPQFLRKGLWKIAMTYRACRASGPADGVNPSSRLGLQSWHMAPLPVNLQTLSLSHALVLHAGWHSCRLVKSK